jgi:hypothetical protein
VAKFEQNLIKQIPDIEYVKMVDFNWSNSGWIITAKFDKELEIFKIIGKGETLADAIRDLDLQYKDIGF